MISPIEWCALLWMTEKSETPKVSRPEPKLVEDPCIPSELLAACKQAVDILDDFKLSSTKEGRLKMIKGRHALMTALYKIENKH